MSRNILNYTTEVSAAKSVGEITALLIRKGATSITTEHYADGRTKSVLFSMQVGGFPVLFSLPANVAGVAAVMLKAAPYLYGRHKGRRDQYEMRMREQAERVAWRILKDWVEAQIALIECGQVETAQVFLPYGIRNDGRTNYEAFVESMKQLTAGE